MGPVSRKRRTWKSRVLCRQEAGEKEKERERVRQRISRGLV